MKPIAVSKMDETNMDREILNATKHAKNVSKKQGTFARIYSIMKKHKKIWQKMN